MYVQGQFKIKFPYFIPAERIPASSWQTWVLLVHMFTTMHAKQQASLMVYKVLWLHPLVYMDLQRLVQTL
jgi:hypothetical protein